MLDKYCLRRRITFQKEYAMLLAQVLDDVSSSHKDLGGGFRISLVHSPREAFRPYLSQDGLLVPLGEVAALAFGMERERDDWEGHVVDVGALAVLRGFRGVIIGFSSATMHPELDLLYLNGVVTHPAFQDQGFGSKLLDVLLETLPSGWIGFTTQNPIIFCAFRSRARRLYPSLEAPIVPAALRETSRILRGQYQGLDPKTGIITDRYPCCLYPSIPMSRDEAVNQWFEKALAITNSRTRHAFLFLGER